ncbi:hypothetical protein SIID45300_00132 [Candidatus Magnetaquicoccaceae bacterium FCR-1]|uniref:MotA/TolQ/ExbB proton channel domain-containing protein n=1 Tax=Candidatus Magnetaquiglobus chichijimensis TaxID=3141448 RepID=A0ABQ0C543_9PROT
MFEWLIHLLNHPALPWIAADLLPVWAIAAWWFTRDAWLEPLRQEIRSARELCDATPDEPEAFAPHLRRLHAGMEGLPRLAPAWRAFVATLIDHDTPNSPIMRGVQPATLFDLTTLSQSNSHAERLNFLPLQLIGAGVLFTFVGLLGALQVASTGLAPNDPSATQQAVRDLLGLAAFKFLASISGLLSAWLFSWRARVWRGRLKKELTLLCDQLAQRFPFVSREQLLHAQLLAMQQLGQGTGQPPLAVRTDGARQTPVTLSLDPVIAALREENDKLRHLIRERLPDAPPAPVPSPAPLSLDPMIAALREENDKLRHLIRERLPDAPPAPVPSPAPLSLDPMIAALREENGKLRDLIRERLPEFPSAPLPMPGESMLVEGTGTTLIGLDPTAWRPLVDSLREEGRQLARELALHLAREIQPLLVRPVEASAMVSRDEQESWMRIVDRMELAARSLERQSEGLDGLGELARETRRASEGSIRANREAVEALVSAVEGFNERMSSSFARSAEALLERLARNNQQIVAQVIEEFDGDRARQVVESVGREEGVSALYQQFFSRRTRNISGLT